jgi:hypothetical protein
MHLGYTDSYGRVLPRNYGSFSYWEEDASDVYKMLLASQRPQDIPVSERDFWINKFKDHQAGLEQMQKIYSNPNSQGYKDMVTSLSHPAVAESAGLLPWFKKNPNKLPPIELMSPELEWKRALNEFVQDRERNPGLFFNSSKDTHWWQRFGLDNMKNTARRYASIFDERVGNASAVWGQKAYKDGDMWDAVVGDDSTGSRLALGVKGLYPVTSASTRAALKDGIGGGVLDLWNVINIAQLPKALLSLRGPAAVAQSTVPALPAPVKTTGLAGLGQKAMEKLRNIPGAGAVSKVFGNSAAQEAVDWAAQFGLEHFTDTGSQHQLPVLSKDYKGTATNLYSENAPLLKGKNWNIPNIFSPRAAPTYNRSNTFSGIDPGSFKPWEALEKVPGLVKGTDGTYSTRK